MTKTVIAILLSLFYLFKWFLISLRSFDDEKKARMGVVECVNHKLIEPFTVLYEKEGEFYRFF